MPLNFRRSQLTHDLGRLIRRKVRFKFEFRRESTRHGFKLVAQQARDSGSVPSEFSGFSAAENMR
jgi:hypothetical protein